MEANFHKTLDAVRGQSGHSVPACIHPRSPLTRRPLKKWKILEQSVRQCEEPLRRSNPAGQRPMVPLDLPLRGTKAAVILFKA
ncbi:MAG: hypothetical protein G3M70_04865 [Candidatus Nitronauta litoralis]|uniref:Uncharacterized protein n=1 Tax=Candidatus Nitronauta litoralis TaxID=2705533 RepID=A0A7T0BUH4_9BACT|nr:MAG: hypothetical protein G3M70_04865 [Candidatus Nitronauta litoralis]